MGCRKLDYQTSFSVLSVSNEIEKSGVKLSYQGKERDGETGYDYFEARLYDSAIGRFMQVDPYAEKFKTMNAYTGMANNPLRVIDPTGMLADFYDDEGGYLGTDGVDDGEVHVTDQETIDANTSTAPETEGSSGSTSEVDWQGVKDSEGTNHIGQESDLVNMNGNTVSSDKMNKALVGLAIFAGKQSGTDYKQVTVLGGDRSSGKNSKVGGAKKSSHLKGEAADYIIAGQGVKGTSQTAIASGLFSRTIHYPAGKYNNVVGALGAHTHSDVNSSIRGNFLYKPVIKNGITTYSNGKTSVTGNFKYASEHKYVPYKQ